MTRDDLFTVTHFFHASARHKTEAQYSLDSLAQTIAAESRDAKDLLPWVKLARFANNPSAKGSLRHDANIVSITGGEGDYDAEKMSYDAAIAALTGANVACIVHTSPSHQADKPRWRVLAPASRELPPGDRYRLVARLNGVLGGVLSAESFTLSQSYLYGHLDNGSEYRALFLEGRCIDQCDDLDVGAIGKPGTKKAGEGNGHGDRYDQPYADRAELIRMIFSGESYHPAARSLLGSYAATGMSKEDALDILHTLGSGQPRYADRWDEIVQLADWVWAKEAAKQAPAPTPGPVIWDSIAWDGVDEPEQEWTVPNLIPANEPCLFSGYGGSGKSTIGLHLASAHALGRDWLGALPELGGAFFIDAEDHIDVIHRRLAAITRHYGCTFKDLIDGGLHILSLHGKDAVMATADRNGIIKPTPLFAQILEQAGDLKPSQVIIAPSSHVYAGSEIDRSQVTQFVNLLTKIAIACGGSVILIAHPSLTGMTNASGISGSTGWHNSMRARMYLETDKNGDDDESQSNNPIRKLKFLKNQYDLLANEISLRWRNGMFLPEPKPTSYEMAAREAKAEEAVLAFMAKCKGKTPLAPSIFARNYPPTAMIKQGETGGFKKNELAGAFDRLMARGTLQVRKWGPPSKPVEYVEIA